MSHAHHRRHQPGNAASAAAAAPGKSSLVPAGPSASAQAVALAATPVPSQPMPDPSTLLADLAFEVKALNLIDHEMEAIEAAGDDAVAAPLAFRAVNIRTRLSNLVVLLDVEADAVHAAGLSEIAAPMRETALELVQRTQPRIEAALHSPPSPAARSPLITGEPIVDRHGTVCDQSSPAVGLDCRLTHDQRLYLMKRLSDHVTSAMIEFREALVFAYVDLATAAEQVGWPLLLDVVIDALLTPAGSRIASAIAKGLHAEAAEVNLAVTGGLKWVKGMTKAKASGLPTGTKGKQEIILMLADSVGPLADYMIGTLAPNLDDGGLVALNDYWQNPSLQSLTAYRGRVLDVLARFDKQVGQVGEVQADDVLAIDDMQLAAAHLFHRGHERPALVKRTQRRGSSGHASEWQFYDWLDSDMAPLSIHATIDRLPSAVGPFYVDDDPPNFARTEKLERALSEWDASNP